MLLDPCEGASWFKRDNISHNKDFDKKFVTAAVAGASFCPNTYKSDSNAEKFGSNYTEP